MFEPGVVPESVDLLKRQQGSVSVSVESTFGEGSTFWTRLPRDQEAV
ncbi:MAG: light-regulated signal transduction histidine kinase (bacteriophytochrome) [Myxococcota bacterium]|jgi:light-regulated signal transduction histidine kinase (bacteriophytochrome)